VNYCDSPYRYRRRPTREVMIGRVGVGGANPIRVQSMITCDTMDTEASIAQTIELAEAGCEIVRITAPTVKDAANLEHIVRGLRDRACDVPIVADIHFKPEAAMEAARWVEKVRITPIQRSSRFWNIPTSNTPRSWSGSANGSRRWSSFARNSDARCGSGRTTVRSRTGS